MARLQLEVHIAEAIEAGREAQDLIADPARALHERTEQAAKSRSPIFGSLHIFEARIKSKRLDKLTDSRRAKIVAKLNLYAAALSPAAEGLADPTVQSAAIEALRWGPQIGDGSRSVADVQRDLSASVGDLQRHQTRLFLERSRSGGANDGV